MERLLHTPDGVRDIYNDECERKVRLQNRLHEVLKSYGYRDIETPTFEFFDLFKIKWIGRINKKVWRLMLRSPKIENNLSKHNYQDSNGMEIASKAVKF